MSRPLEGRTIALAEGRQLEELAGLLESEGAATLCCPLLSILDAPDPAPVLAWIDELIVGRFSWVVLMTGEALRRLVGFADRAGKHDAFVAAIGKTRTLCRGPKPGRALKEIGLAPTKVASAPTTEGVIATLREEPLSEQTVGVTLFSAENPHLVDYLRSAGAIARTVMPYVYAPAADDERVVDMIGRLDQGSLDAIVFTSSPQVERLFEVAKKRGLEGPLRRGLQRTRVAAVGPVVAVMLRAHQVSVHVCPEQGWVMKNLVRQIIRDLGGG
jgi:uroporphyrinogen-III synthase